MKTVFFDIDTQLDFLYPAGALYVPGAEGLLPAFAALNRYAAAHSIPVVSTTDAHLENDPEFTQWPPHCIAGTLGQQKAAPTLLDSRAVVPVGPCEASIEGAQQIIVQKRHIDVFQSNLPAVVERLAADRYVVYGVVTEYCVRAAALGLLRRGKAVEVVTDAIKEISEDAGQRSLDEIVAAGGRLTTLSPLLGH